VDESFIKRRRKIPKAPNALPISQCLRESTAEGKRNILHSVMIINPSVPNSLYFDI
jgi:hypothetical protein